jgi:hypothetical protein
MYVRQEAEALIALKKVLDGLMTAKLDSLDLSDNALGEKGVRAAGDLLKAQVRAFSYPLVRSAYRTLDVAPSPLLSDAWAKNAALMGALTCVKLFS